jgi:hypothetical protein
MRARIEKLALVLEAQIFVVRGEIGFGALPAEGKLADIRQMLFAGELQGVSAGLGGFFGLCLLRRSAAQTQNDKQGCSQEQGWADRRHATSAHRFHLGIACNMPIRFSFSRQVFILKLL